MKVKTILIFLIWAVALPSVESVEANAIGKAAARGAAKSLSQSVNRGLAQKLSQDLIRDRRTAVRLLNRDTRVFRYTHTARSEMRSGLRPGAHMTTKVTPGRPLTAANAQIKYGLPAKPTDRITVSLPKGTPYRQNKVLGGKPGVPEMSLPRGTLPGSTEKRIHLR